MTTSSLLYPQMRARFERNLFAHTRMSLYAGSPLPMHCGSGAGLKMRGADDLIRDMIEALRYAPRPHAITTPVAKRTVLHHNSANYRNRMSCVGYQSQNLQRVR